MRGDQHDDIVIEMARVDRVAWETITMKMASQQLGEAWSEDRREVETVKRGPQRRWEKGAAHELSETHAGSNADSVGSHQLHV